MEFFLIKPDSPEWEYMWGWLESHPLNEGYDEPSVCLNEATGDAWKYIWSFGDSNNRLVHEFNHISHPNGNVEGNAFCPSSKNFSKDDIFKTIKII
jgi:hypothetical protein